MYVVLVLPGLTAGCLASTQNSAEFNFLNYIPDDIFNFTLCLKKVRCYCSHSNAF